MLLLIKNGRAGASPPKSSEKKRIQAESLLQERREKPANDRLPGLQTSLKRRREQKISHLIPNSLNLLACFVVDGLGYSTTIWSWILPLESKASSTGFVIVSSREIW